VGRQIWTYIKVDSIEFFDGPYRVQSFKQLLHAGLTNDGVERKRSLVQLYTDPGGMRTLAVADIWAKDPGRSDKPW
jgi:hypothetical protein